MSKSNSRGMLQNNVVRLALGLVVLAVGLVIVGIVAFVLYRSSRAKPLAVGIYPGSTQVGSEVIDKGFDHQQYRTTDTMEQVELFYAQHDMACSRQYQTYIERPGQEPVREGHISTRCLLDRSSFGFTQYTLVTIQPLLDQAGNPTPQVVIDVQRHWDV